MIDLPIDHQRVERNKQLRRDLWDYKRVEWIPFFPWMNLACGTSLHERLQNPALQLEANLAGVARALELIPYDYIPGIFVTPGYMTIASMFGMELYWGHDPEQPPGVVGPLIDDLEQVYSLRRPSMEDGLMPDNVCRLQYNLAHLPPDVYVTGIDAGGPMNTLKDLLETNLLYLGLYDNPRAMHYLLDMVTEVQLEIYHTLARVVGLERMTCLDFDPDWAPEKHKSFVSEDVGATLGPDFFAEFSLPYNNRLFQPWGSGGLHNCGPNPCKRLYLAHTPKVKYLNCSYKYSHAEFPEFRELFAGWGIIKPMFDNGETPEQMLAGFRYMLESLAPDVIGLPLCIIDDTWTDRDITDFYWDMHKIGQEYAANVRWVGDEPSQELAI
jgi:hypothetical protein